MARDKPAPGCASTANRPGRRPRGSRGGRPIDAFGARTLHHGRQPGLGQGRPQLPAPSRGHCREGPARSHHGNGQALRAAPAKRAVTIPVGVPGVGRPTGARARGEAGSPVLRSTRRGRGQREIAVAAMDPPPSGGDAPRSVATRVPPQPWQLEQLLSGGPPGWACSEAEGGFRAAKASQPNPGQPLQANTRSARLGGAKAPGSWGTLRPPRSPTASALHLAVQKILQA